MLKAINTKILIAILAVLTTIAGLLVHQHGETKRAAEAAAKTAAILKQQQDEARTQKDREAAFWEDVQDKQKKSKALNKGGSDTWQHYLP